MLFKRLVVLVLLLGFGGCDPTGPAIALTAAMPGILIAMGGLAKKKAAKEKGQAITAFMNKLVGKSEEAVIFELGVPTSTYTTGDLRVCKYYWYYGRGDNIVFVPGSSYSTAVSSSYSKYDEITVYFRNGKLVDWKGYVQR